MCSLLLKAKILFWYKEKDKEPEMRFKKKTFDDALLLIPSYTEGIEAEVSKLKDPSIKCLRSNKAAPPKKKQWFIRIGCTAVATRNWIAHQSAAKQVAQCQRSPRASINLSRVLFMECSIVFNELDKAHSNTYEPVAITPSEEGQQHIVASVTTPLQEVSRSAANASLSTPSNPELVVSNTPYLDGFVGHRDKSDKSKVKGVLHDLIRTVKPSRTVEVQSVNGKKSLIVAVPQCQSERGFLETAKRTQWLQDVISFPLQSAAAGATAFSKFLARNHENEFLIAAKECLGLAPIKPMGTHQCEAVIQDANLSMNQFRLVRRHLNHASEGQIKMRYRKNEKKALETGPRFGPEPMFGKYDDENENGEAEECLFWSTHLSEELQYAVESDVINIASSSKEIELPLYPHGTIDVIVGLDHGQGALSGFAKFLLTSPSLRKEKENLSYGCPIAKICHIQCRKDTYRIMKRTIANVLNESIKLLKESRVIIIFENKSGTEKVQTILIPTDAHTFSIDEDRQFKFMVPVTNMHGDLEQVSRTIELDPLFQSTPVANLQIDSSIKGFRIFVTGDLAFYAMALGKPNTSSYWCTWCSMKKTAFGQKVHGQLWTLERLKDTKQLFDNRTAKSKKNRDGVSTSPLIDAVEPIDYIFPVLHEQIGLVNKSLKHMNDWAEKYVEKLPEGHVETRDELLDSEKARSEIIRDYEAFVQDHCPRLEGLQEQLDDEPLLEDLAILEIEINDLEEEKALLQDAKNKAITRVATANKKYRSMRTQRGKKVEGFAYQLDRCLQQVGAKREAYHGGDLNGNSARTVMEESEQFFDKVHVALLAVKHDECELTNEQLQQIMESYRQLYTLLGTCFSLLRQILPTENDLEHLEDSIDLARKLWVSELSISCTPKAHALFDGHAFEQHKRLSGIGDKLEDYVEKGHQVGLRNERRTWNMQNWEMRQRSQIKHNRRGRRAEIASIISDVNTSSKRNLKRLLQQGGESLKTVNKRAKQEQTAGKREQNLQECRDRFGAQT